MTVSDPYREPAPDHPDEVSQDWENRYHGTDHAGTLLQAGLLFHAHHIRQSDLRLPFIVKKKYGGMEYSVSEYTMSEIIASVYDMIESTELKRWILFLDKNFWMAPRYPTAGS